MSILPEDLLADVLARLPVQLLIRFRVVSKSWRALIDSKVFTELKLNFDRSVLRPPNSESATSSCSMNKFIWPAEIVLDKSRKKFWNKLYASDFDSPDMMNATMVELPCPFKPRLNMEIWVNGSCNGLLCLSYSNFSVILWNPCTNKHWKLPFSPVNKIDNLGHRVSDLKRSVYYALGYDDTRDDYKVVRVVKLLDESKVPLHQEVKIYSLKSNTWSSLPLPPQFPYFLALRGFMTGFLIDRSLHWIMADRDHSADYTTSSSSDVIVALDLRTDKYHLIPQPPHNISTLNRWDLGVLDGCLCVLSGTGYGIDMWIMKDYGKKDSWAKINLRLPYVICDDWFHRNCFFLYPIAFSKRGTEILLQKENAFMWYDIEKCSVQKTFYVGQKVKDLSMILSAHCVSAVAGCYFLGSLVNPCGGTDTGGSRKWMMKCSGRDLSGKRVDTSTTHPLRRSIRLKDREGRKRRRI